MSTRAINLDEPRVPLATKAPRRIREIIEEIALQDDRSLSNTVVRLLEESPRVKEKLAPAA